MGKESLRTTELEQRLGAQRLLMAMLIAHLQDNGLIDKEVLEADCLATQDLAELGEHAQQDIEEVFHLADLKLGEWKPSWQQTDEPPV